MSVQVTGNNIKVDLTPRRHHGYSVILFIFGTLLPPLAVAARFGVGKDFWINLVCTLCGYFPGHGHNFYIQNIRNNKNHARTPKWIQRYGLVDTSEIQRKDRKSQWANRYNDRLPGSTLEGQDYEEGQIPDRPPERRRSNSATANGNQLWGREDEQFYNGNGEAGSVRSSGSGSGGGRWHYPANFEDTDVPLDAGKKKGKKDRWARTDDAYSSAGKKRKKSKRGRKGADQGDFVRSESYSSTNDGTVIPEDPEGGLFGPSHHAASDTDRVRQDRAPSSVRNARDGQEDFNHQF